MVLRWYWVLTVRGEAHGHRVAGGADGARDVGAGEGSQHGRVGVRAVVHGQHVAADAVVGATARGSALERDLRDREADHGADGRLDGLGAVEVVAVAVRAGVEAAAAARRAVDRRVRAGLVVRERAGLVGEDRGDAGSADVRVPRLQATVQLPVAAGAEDGGRCHVVRVVGLGVRGGRGSCTRGGGAEHRASEQLGG